MRNFRTDYNKLQSSVFLRKTTTKIIPAFSCAVNKNYISGVCKVFLHRRFRSISAFSALSAIMPVAHSVRLCYLPPTPFIPHYPFPYTIHLDTTVAHSSLIVLSSSNPFHPSILPSFHPFSFSPHHPS